MEGCGWLTDKRRVGREYYRRLIRNLWPAALLIINLKHKKRKREKKCQENS